MERLSSLCIIVIENGVVVAVSHYATCNFEPAAQCSCLHSNSVHNIWFHEDL